MLARTAKQSSEQALYHADRLSYRCKLYGSGSVAQIAAKERRGVCSPRGQGAKPGQVPPPSSGDYSKTWRGSPAYDTREILLDAIIDDEPCNRLVMGHAQFMCFHRRVFERGTFYALAEDKLVGLSNLFPDDELEIFLGLRNPATFIPRCSVTAPSIGTTRS